MVILQNLVNKNLNINQKRYEMVHVTIFIQYNLNIGLGLARFDRLEWFGGLVSWLGGFRFSSFCFVSFHLDPFRFDSLWGFSLLFG